VRWAKLQKGECHVMPYPNPADLDAIRKDPKVKVLEQPGLNVGYLAYNVTKKPFDDVRVRKAINMAINKKAIIDGVYLGSAIAAKNPLPPTMSAYNDAVKDDPYDPEAAKKLLAQAGYPNGFTTDLWAMPVQRPYNPNAKRIAEVPVAHAERAAGDSKYGLWKLINLQFDLLTSFSLLPLQMLSVLGLCVSLTGIGFGVALMIYRYLHPEGTAQGVFTLFAVLFFFVGAQFLAFGLLGEYIGRFYQEVRDRPRFVIKKVHKAEE
jgi:hypothetical protein